MTRRGKGPRFSVAPVSANVLTVRLDGISAGWEQWVLLRSDAHHDSALSDQDFERRHLEEARARDALILDAGDLFDAMAGPGDRRAQREHMRNEHSRTDYFDRLVETAAEFYGPYADRLAVIARGNHEAAVAKHYATDLTDRLAYRLRTEHGGITQAGGYGGWVRFMLHIHKTIQRQIRLKYYHGSGGGGPVTRGVIQTNRQAVYLPDADIVLNGHVHENYYVAVPRERLTNDGQIYHDIQHHVRTPTYKDEYRDGGGGWHVETGKPPKAIGAVWMRLFLPRGGQEHRVEVEFTSALKSAAASGPAGP